MERHPHDRGGNVKLKLVAAGGALALAALAKVGVLLFNGNKRNPQQHSGGWRELGPEDLH